MEGKRKRHWKIKSVNIKKLVSESVGIKMWL
jgi:hypothetical protein